MHNLHFKSFLYKLVIFFAFVAMFLINDLKAENNFKLTLSRNSFALGDYSIKSVNDTTSSEGTLKSGSTSTFELGVEYIILSQFGLFLSYQNASYDSKDEIQFNSLTYNGSVTDSPITLAFKGYFFRVDKSNHLIFLSLGQTFRKPSFSLIGTSSGSGSYSYQFEYETIDIGAGYEYILDSVTFGVKYIYSEAEKASTVRDSEGNTVKFAVDSNKSYFGLNIGLIF